MRSAGRDGARGAWVRVVAGAAVLAIVATACGGGGPRLARDAFTKRGDAECAALASASEKLGNAQAEGSVGDDVRGYVESAADEVRKLAGALGDLRPPEALDGELGDLVSALDDYSDGLEEIAARVKATEGLRATLDAAPKLVARLNGIAQHATELVGTLGLQQCQLSG